MASSSIQAQLKAYYNNSLILIEQGNAVDARKYILAVLNGLRGLHESSEISYLQKATIEHHMRELYQVAVILRTSGVNDTVKMLMGMSTPTPATAQGEQRTSNTPLDTHQDWCANIFGKYKKGVVHIRATDRGVGGSGTGFIISKKGYLLTNAHVVVNSERDALCANLSFSFINDSIKHKMHVIEFSKEWDIALCRSEESLGESITVIPRIKDYSQLEQGADVVVIGNAFSMGLAPFSGIVKFTHDEEGNLVYTAPSNPGDSGGPVFNGQGECVGINKSITAAVNCGGSPVMAQGLTNATPMDRIDEMLDKWCKKHDITL